MYIIKFRTENYNYEVRTDIAEKAYECYTELKEKEFPVSLSINDIKVMWAN